MKSSPVEYNRDTHEHAVRIALASSSKRQGEANGWLWITGGFSLFAAIGGQWLFVAINVALFAYWYYQWKSGKRVAQCILNGHFNYPNQVVEQTFTEINNEAASKESEDE